MDQVFRGNFPPVSTVPGLLVEERTLSAISLIINLISITYHGKIMVELFKSSTKLHLKKCFLLYAGLNSIRSFTYIIQALMSIYRLFYKSVENDNFFYYFCIVAYFMRMLDYFLLYAVQLVSSWQANRWMAIFRGESRIFQFKFLIYLAGISIIFYMLDEGYPYLGEPLSSLPSIFYCPARAVLYTIFMTISVVIPLYCFYKMNFGGHDSQDPAITRSHLTIKYLLCGMSLVAGVHVFLQTILFIARNLGDSILFQEINMAVWSSYQWIPFTTAVLMDYVLQVYFYNKPFWPDFIEQWKKKYFGRKVGIIALEMQTAPVCASRRDDSEL